MGHGYRPLISKIRIHNPNKTGSKKANYNYLHYIATREGVDLTRINSMDDLVQENVDLNSTEEETVYNHANDVDYLKYMSYRPRSHGLFGNIETENFSDVSKKINAASAQKKNIYRGIISLSGQDAKTLGYNSADKWDVYLKSVMPDIALTLGLSPNNMTWVAAFHAEDAHPHVHYMLWDNRDVVKSPYIHVKTQEACRQICQDKMFPDEYESIIRSISEEERKEYYKKQNEARTHITDQFKDILYRKDIVPGTYTESLPGRFSAEEHEKLSNLYKNILQTLPKSGRISYKFMPMECKAYIDQVSDIFLQKPEIKREYNQYIKAIEDIHKSLGKTSKEIKEEKNYAINELHNRTGNIVLKAVSLMRDDIIYSDKKEYESDMDFSDEYKNQENMNGSEPDSGPGDGMLAQTDLEEEDVNRLSPEENEFRKLISKLTYDKSKDYNPVMAEEKLLGKLSGDTDDRTKAYCFKKLGKMYAADRLILNDYEKAVFYLEAYREYDDNNFEVTSTLGKIYGNKKYESWNPEKAEKYYLHALELNENTNYIRLRLSRLYNAHSTDLYDCDKAIHIMDGSIDTKGSISLQLGNIYNDTDNYCYDKQMAMEHFTASAEKNNCYAMYNLGKMYIEDPETLEKGLEYLEQAASGNVLQAHLQAAKIYMRADCEFFDLDQAELHLAEVELQLNKITENPYAVLSKDDLEMMDAVKFYYGKIYVHMSNMEKAIESFGNCIAEHRDNFYTQNARVNLCRIYTDWKREFYNMDKAVEIAADYPDSIGNIAVELGKSFINQDAPHYNEDKAYTYFEEAAEKGNRYAAYYLGKMMTDPDSKYYNVRKGADWLQKAADQNILPAITRLSKLYMDPERGMCSPSDAVKLLENTLNNIKDDPVYCSMQADIYIELGKIYADNRVPVIYNLDKAVENLQKAIDLVAHPVQRYDAEAQLARIYGNKYAEMYNPHTAIDNYQKALTGYNNIISTENDPDEFILRKINNVKIGLSTIYADKECELCNYDVALDLLKGIPDKSGYVDLQMGSIYAEES